MRKTPTYRYAKKKGDMERDYNLHIREMIEMLKNEVVKTKLNVKNVKLSNHAFERMSEHFGKDSRDNLTETAKEMLKKAVRIGLVLSYDGRINVLYAYHQTALFLSPDLKTLVTVYRYPTVTYRKFVNENVGDRKTLIDMHLKLLREIEEREQEYTEKIINIERRVSETTKQLTTMLSLVRSGERKRSMKSIISELNYQLKKEGRKLFELNVEKRHICKSLVALY